MDSVVVFVINFPLESDLSVGQRYPHFEQLSLDGFASRQSWNKFLYRASKQATSFDCGSWSCQHLIFDFDCLYQFICHHYHYFWLRCLKRKPDEQNVSDNDLIFILSCCSFSVTEPKSLMAYEVNYSTPLRIQQFMLGSLTPMSSKFVLCILKT